MDGDLGAMLQGVLSDPEQMAKLAQMAQGLMGAAAAPEPPPEAPPSAAPFSEGESKLLSVLGRTFGQSGEKSRSTALLIAMRPYLKPEKQEKLDRALRMTRMVRMAQTVLGELSGHGV